MSYTDPAVRRTAMPEWSSFGAVAEVRLTIFGSRNFTLSQ